MRSAVLLALLPALAACKNDPPPAPPAPPTAAEDSAMALLADTASATDRYTGQRQTSMGAGSVVYLWLRPGGAALFAVDARDGAPLQPKRGTYTTVEGTGAEDAPDTLTLVLPGDTTRFVVTPDSLLETRRDTLIEAHLLRMARSK